MANSTAWHEPQEVLPEKTRDLHRALLSLQEELEAVDWYRQRADACGDAALREVLLHNMREEIEHATMVLEWIRRNDGDFDANLRTYLFTEVPITEVEQATAAAEAAGQAAAPSAPPPPPRFTIGDMKGGVA